MECEPRDFASLQSFITDLHRDLRPTKEFSLYKCDKPGRIVVRKDPFLGGEDDQQSYTLGSVTNMNMSKVPKIPL